MSDPLEVVKLKIERAEAHWHEVFALVKTFAESHSYTVGQDVEPDGQIVLKGKFTDVISIPALIPVVAGEVLYQLRSALDHMTCALAAENGATDSQIRHSSFPTGNERDHFEAEAKEKIHYLSDAAKLAIAALEPFNGGNGEALRTLHTINLRDKHHGLIPVAAVPTSASATIMFKPGVAGRPVTVSSPQFPAIVNNEVVFMRLPAGSTHIALQGDPQITLDVAFSHPRISKGETILPSLKQFIGLVDGVVKIFGSNTFFKSIP